MADVIQSAGTGAAAGSALGPYGAAVGGVVGGAGALIGNMFANDAAREGADTYAQYAQQGINGLKDSQGQFNATNGQYVQSGLQNLGNANNLLGQRLQATNPTVTNNTGANAIQNYLNPSAGYSTAQSNNALQASALAGGGNTGGGMAKALSNNASQMAMTNYNNAYQQMLGSNAQTFGQQQQLYGNDTAYQNQMFSDTANLAKMGQDANTSGGQINLGYGNSILGAYEGIGNAYNGSYNTVGQNTNAAVNSTSANFGNAASQIASKYLDSED